MRQGGLSCRKRYKITAGDACRGVSAHHHLWVINAMSSKAERRPDKYATFSGRTSRSELCGSRCSNHCGSALDLFVAPDPDYNGIYAAFPVALIWFRETFLPSIAMSVRRMRDADKHGAFLFVPICNIVLRATTGTSGTNKYRMAPIHSFPNRSSILSVMHGKCARRKPAPADGVGFFISLNLLVAAFCTFATRIPRERKYSPIT